MKAVTANLLATGEVVYLDTKESWTPRLVDAALFPDAEAQDALELALLRVREIAGAYLIEAEAGEAGGRERLRETIRNAGPTVHPELGKQAGARS